MAAVNPYQQYQQQSVMTATPGELTLLLYNGAIKFINLARQAIENKDISSANTNIIRAQDIINELMNTLDMNYDISHNMYALYDYMVSRLVDANINKNAAILDEVSELVTDMRNTWAEVIKINRQKMYREMG